MDIRTFYGVEMGGCESGEPVRLRLIRKESFDELLEELLEELLKALERGGVV
tara:strand:- start:625 stop:780 length:156 start_codon:yes stop_codon:yes gene_type:complete